MVRRRGLEPPRPYVGHYPLKVARLPVPPPTHSIDILTKYLFNLNQICFNSVPLIFNFLNILHLKQMIYYASYLSIPFIILMVWIFFRYETVTSRIFSGILIFISLVYIYSFFIEPNILLVNYEKITINESSDHKAKIKAVLFGDPHAGVYKNGVSLERIVKKVNELNPDIVFIAGDFLYNLKYEHYNNELAVLADINAPVYAVTGNHDVLIEIENPAEKLRTSLRKSDVIVIDNAVQNIEINGVKLKIIGLSDLWEGRMNYDVLKNAKEDENTILLVHNPDMVYDFPFKAEVDLILAGHTHGGQIRLPGLYQQAIPTEYPFDKGHYNISGIPLYVTSGIGMTGLPFRFLIPPQIEVLEINFIQPTL
jgi:predicted MPP superfamily phosphohydrolase